MVLSNIISRCCGNRVRRIGWRHYPIANCLQPIWLFTFVKLDLFSLDEGDKVLVILNTMLSKWIACESRDIGTLTRATHLIVLLISHRSQSFHQCALLNDNLRIVLRQPKIVDASETAVTPVLIRGQRGCCSYQSMIICSGTSCCALILDASRRRYLEGHDKTSSRKWEHQMSSSARSRADLIQTVCTIAKLLAIRGCRNPW